MPGENAWLRDGSGAGDSRYLSTPQRSLGRLRLVCSAAQEPEGTRLYSSKTLLVELLKEKLCNLTIANRIIAAKSFKVFSDTVSYIIE